MVCCVTPAQLAEILAVAPPVQSDRAIATGIATDTRNLKGGEVFVALRGENFDGHKFVAKALELGAIAAVVDRSWESEGLDLPLLRVEDTLKAYQAIARWWRDQFNIPVIAVTGSVGKTTTKELIAAVLTTKGNVLKTQLNYNNEIGVPKTLLELSESHHYAVIEMGMRASGEIAFLTQIARPTIAVITNVGTAHIGRLGSREAIAQAKCELLAEMPNDSIAILNSDNALLMATAAKVWQGETLAYGLEKGNLCPELIDDRTISIDSINLPLPLPGRHNAVNYLAALAVAKVLGVSWEPLKGGLSVDLPSGRAKRYELANDIVILDETYNAGLESMIAALKLLADTPGKRHIAVLGTMKELGERSLEFHRQVGEKARELNLDALFILADFEEASAIATGAAGLPFVELGDITQVDAREMMAKRLQEFVKAGDRILFKASHSVELNRVVQLLVVD
ncbi:MULTISPECIES: UDP-N-acetylmuramoyl-tripeptide--D-alanyl-D-alanine ligase [Kamptonema]|uniref:UDP-N-acetylmuramoyl-tripeptide--D-alanyl-D- alanine ligase n=1 Tax=Kamptonema TaxID=1501433 RepID=UPI0001DAC8CD|nr:MULTISPECIES: UDP-N-acetylmuramoyl-tripeptide--D-alanyl-D-alanine ligase [Kamptonema]CBN59144.1 UDP-N-acetylmuramoyl-tripeptide--D-alanyl-D-alanine ligase [Kamptonema sp. PCC 6506]